MRYVMTVIASILSAGCAAALGVLFTVAHRATVHIAGIEVPYGLLLGVVATVTFLTAMRLLWDNRWPTTGGALGLLIAVGVLSFGDVGDSIIVAADGYGWTWLALSLLITVGAVVWPARRRRGPTRDADTIDGLDSPVKEHV